MSYRNRWSRGWRRRRAWGAPALVSWVLVMVSVGVVPGPGLLARWGVGRSGERYPCEGCACACGSAERCWTACCCHTVEQRIAWARREGVAIPAFAWRVAHGGEPACALCEAGGTWAPTLGEASGEEGAGERRPDGLPALSPMACIGLEMLVALTPPPTVIRAGWWMQSGARPERAAPTDWPEPAWRAIDAPTPPPRRTAA